MSDIPKLARIKQDDENMEKLHIASRKGQLDHIRRLIGLGVNPSIQNKFGCTALHLACKFGQVHAVRELAPISDLQQPWHGQKPLHLAVVANNHEVVKVLIESVRAAAKTPFEIFLNDCDEYDHTYDIGGGRSRNVVGQTALHWCVGLGPSHREMLQNLLDCGANPMAKDRAGETALMRAIEFGNHEAFEMMMEAGARGAEAPPPPPVIEGLSPSSPVSPLSPPMPGLPPPFEHFPTNLRLESSDKQGRTCLHYAIYCNQPEIAHTLLKYGYDVNWGEDTDKQSCIMLALRAAMPTILEILVFHPECKDLLDVKDKMGREHFPEAIEYLPFVGEADPKKADALKVFQKRYEMLHPAINEAEKKGKAKGKSGKAAGKETPMAVAPSAPYGK